jgi:hypothetical protein
MPTFAGTIWSGTPTNPQWVPCDGRSYFINDPKRAVRPPIPNTASTGTRWDYLRAVGWYGRRLGLGHSGWAVRVPYDPSGTYVVSLADDNSESTLSGTATVQNPPPGVR